MSEAPDVASSSEVRAVFERGAVYADRWSPEVRAALDVADPLLAAVTTALSQGRSVVLTGNAGDGKSHLAQRALDSISTRRSIEVTATLGVPDPVPENSIVFLRDVSGLTDGEVLRAVRLAGSARTPILMTINEGPLESLARHPEGDLFREVREIVHERGLGRMSDDPEPTLIVNLSGRQLSRAGFIAGALDKLLPVVGACPTCRKGASCPRVVGARMLRKSAAARDRLEALVRLLTDGGRHTSAREVWVFLIDLFFGWVCPAQAGDADRTAGYFWMRVFEGGNSLSRDIAAEFDPVNVPMAGADVGLWQGRPVDRDPDFAFPGSKPVEVARQLGETAGLRTFQSAKRCYFFFGRSLDTDRLLSGRSLAPRFGRLLATATTEPRPVIRELVGLINRYRLALETENELWISRHHSFAAHRRPAALGAAGKLPIDELETRIPHQHDAQRFPRSGFFPTRLYLHWLGSAQPLEVDFETWQRLQSERTLTVDRGQESLDFALDLFMAQAPIGAEDDPEILVFDHRHKEETLLRIRPEERRIEVLR